jgi:hypothetical protein
MTKRLMILFAAILLVTGMASAQGMGGGQGMGLGQAINQFLGQMQGMQGQMNAQALTQAVSMGVANAMKNGTITPLTPAEMVDRRVDMLTKLLDLTASQQTDITAILTKEVADLTPLRTSLDAERDKLEAAVKSVPAGDVAKLSASIGTLQGQVIAIGANTQVAFRKLLTTDQLTKLDAIHDHFGRP